MNNENIRTPARGLLAVLLGVAVTLSVVPMMSARAADPMTIRPVTEINVKVTDQGTLQRGARLFMNYCVGCHSLRYMRYSQLAKGLGLTKEQVLGSLDFTGAKFHDTIISAMPKADAVNWFGKAPPDLSLIIGAKGAGWVSAYLKSFYIDPKAASGWNNTVFPNVAMPFPLWHLQGIQAAVMNPPKNGQPATVKKLVLTQPGTMTPAQYDQAVLDIVTFLSYVSRPDKLVRSHIGAWVILYLALFTGFALLLKREYWKDLH